MPANAAADMQRWAAILRAYDRLTPEERQGVDRLIKRLREQVHGIGPQAALEIVAAVGIMLCDDCF